MAKINQGYKNSSNMQGTADPAVLNQVHEIPGLEMMSEFGAGAAERAGQQKNAIRDDHITANDWDRRFSNRHPFDHLRNQQRDSAKRQRFGRG